MVSVCFYFQVHQPYRLANYSVFDIGRHRNYYNHGRNKHEMAKIAKKCYLPTNNLLLDLIRENPGFKISYSLSGVVIDQFEELAPDVLASFQGLVDTGNVEMLDETYYHSLSFLYSKDEFVRQIKLHNKRIRQVFGVKPTVFRNTELVYNNELGKMIEKLGYKAILAEGADHILGWRSPNFVYRPLGAKKTKLLLKNYRLSDDVAFRFSNRGWKEWPLTADKFANWISQVNGNGNTVNLFMDYETFGEHQWEDTGIFSFMQHLPKYIERHPDNDFKTPSEVAEAYPAVSELDIHLPVSWADLERDLSAWLGNPMQQAAIAKLYSMEQRMLASKDDELIRDWRKLQISDHFYYMCTKWFSDGDVHKYFNPYESPYDAFISFMNVLADMEHRLNAKALEKPMLA